MHIYAHTQLFESACSSFMSILDLINPIIGLTLSRYCVQVFAYFVPRVRSVNSPSRGPRWGVSKSYSFLVGSVCLLSFFLHASSSSPRPRRVSSRKYLSQRLMQYCMLWGTCELGHSLLRGPHTNSSPRNKCLPHAIGAPLVRYMNQAMPTKHVRRLR